VIYRFFHKALFGFLVLVVFSYPVKSQVDSAYLSNYDRIFGVAQQYAWDKQYHKSQVLCKYILDTLPAYSEVRLLLGRTYAWDTHYDSARTVLNQVFDYQNIDTEVGYNAIDALVDNEYWSDNHLKAIEYCNEGLIHFPDSLTLEYKKARSLRETGKFLDAKRNLFNVLQVNPGHQEAKDLYEIVSNSIYVNNPDKRYASYPDFKYTRIDDVGRLMEQANKIAWNEEFGDATIVARDICNTIIASIPDHREAILLLARTYSWDEEFEAGRKELRKLDVESTGDMETLKTWIDLESWAKNHYRVINYCDLGQKFFPEEKLFTLKRVEAYALSGNLPQAKKMILELLRKDPYDQEVISIYNKISSGEPLTSEQAEVELQVFIQTMERAGSLYNRARDYAYAGNYEEARSLCQEILDMRNDYMEARTLIGHTYAWEENFVTANEYYHGVLAEEFNNWDAINGLINTGLWDKNYEQTFEYCDYGLSIYPRDQIFLLAKAKAYEYSENLENAKITAAYILDINPSNPEAKKYFYSLKGPGAWDGFGVDQTYDFFNVPYERKYTLTSLKGFRTIPKGTFVGAINYGRLLNNDTGVYDKGTQFDLSFYPRFKNKNYGMINLGLSSAYFMPRIKFNIGYYHEFGETTRMEGYEASLTYSFLRYVTVEDVGINASFVTASFGKYFGSNFAGLSVSLMPFSEGLSQGYNLNFRRFFTSADDWVNLGVGLGRSPNDPRYYLYDSTSPVNENLNSANFTVGFQKRFLGNMVGRASFTYYYEEYMVGLFRNHYVISGGLIYTF